MGFFTSIRIFLETGGWVLLVLMGVLLLMWGLVIERVLYHRTAFPRDLEEAARVWKTRGERTSWKARKIRQQLVSELRLKLERSLPLVRMLVGICSLVGLLGTVTGMVEVFDVMAILGTGNPRSMASGVYRAIIPSMAGMVSAISGLFAYAWLDRRTKYLRGQLEDRLPHE